MFKTGMAGSVTGGGGNIIGNAGSKPLLNGDQSVSIVFAQPQTLLTYRISFSFENLTDADPIMLQGIVTAKSLAGFTVKFNAPTDSANYTFDWEIAQDV